MTSFLFDNPIIVTTRNTFHLAKAYVGSGTNKIKTSQYVKTIWLNKKTKQSNHKTGGGVL